MNTSYILAFLCLVLEIYFLIHTRYVIVQDYNWKPKYETELKRYKFPIYIYVLLIVTTLIPYAWIVSIIIFTVIWSSMLNDADYLSNYNYRHYKFRDYFFMKKI